MSKTYTTLSREGYTYLIGLIRNLANVSEGIDDLHLLSNGTFSSVKIDTLLNTLRSDCNEYTDRLVANLSRLELKIANDESEISQPNIMYLYKASGETSYSQYVVIEGTKILLGTCDIDMGDYYTITQADAKFVLKTDFDSLKTEVERKVNKTDIIDNLTSTDTDKPLSANQGKVLKDEVDLKANDDEVVKKTDISTTINSTSTNDTVAGAKAVNDKLSQYVHIDGENMLLRCTSSGTVFTDFIDKNCTSNFRAYHVVWNSLVSGTPCGDGYCTVYTYNESLHKKVIAYDVSGNAVWEITQIVGVWGTWQQVRSGVTDVPIMYINTFENETYVKPTRNDVCSYYVTNGFCTVTIEAVCLSTSDNFVQILSGLPKPKTTVYSNAIDRQMGSNSGAKATFQLTHDGVLRVACSYGDPAITEVVRNFYVAFSYPVAES